MKGRKFGEERCVDRRVLENIGGCVGNMFLDLAARLKVKVEANQD